MITFMKVRFTKELNQIVYIRQKYIKRCNLHVNKYKDELKSNQIIEIDKKGNKILHSILKVPGEDNEKE